MKRILLALICIAFSLPSYAQVKTGPLVLSSPRTMTAGGTWQALFPAQTNRTALLIENPCTNTTQGIATAENLFIGFGTKPTSTVTGGVVEIAPCGSFLLTNGYVSQQAVWIDAATTGHAFFGAQTQ